MIPTKTYPLSAIMGEEMTDKERIAELEAEVTMRREQAEGLQNQWVKDTQKIVALEAENARLKAAMDKYSEDEMLKHLAIAVTALRKIEINDDCYESAPIAREALLQIEEEK